MDCFCEYGITCHHFQTKIPLTLCLAKFCFGRTLCAFLSSKSECHTQISLPVWDIKYLMKLPSTQVRQRLIVQYSPIVIIQMVHVCCICCSWVMVDFVHILQGCFACTGAVTPVQQSCHGKKNFKPLAVTVVQSKRCWWFWIHFNCSD